MESSFSSTNKHDGCLAWPSVLGITGLKFLHKRGLGLHRIFINTHLAQHLWFHSKPNEISVGSAFSPPHSHFWPSFFFSLSVTWWKWCRSSCFTLSALASGCWALPEWATCCATEPARAPRSWHCCAEHTCLHLGWPSCGERGKLGKSWGRAGHSHDKQS